jgi:isopropylmalate/homocitrate/citramalate synthase
VYGKVSAVAEIVELGAVMVVSSTSRRVDEVTDSGPAAVVDVGPPPVSVVVVCSTVVGETPPPDVVDVCSTVVGVTPPPDVVDVCSTVVGVTPPPDVVDVCSTVVEGAELLVVVPHTGQ